MSDIVERLDDYPFCPCEAGGGDRAVLSEAAAEITRLRAEVEKLTAENASLASWQCEFTDGKTGLVYSEGGSTYCAMAKREATLRATNDALKDQVATMIDNAARVASLRAQNAALREALEPFAGIKADDGDDFGKWPDEVTIKCYVVVHQIKTARAALAAQKEKTDD